MPNFWGTTGDEDGDCYPDGWAARKEAKEKLIKASLDTKLNSLPFKEQQWLTEEGVVQSKSEHFMYLLGKLGYDCHKVSLTALTAEHQAQVASTLQLKFLSKVHAKKVNNLPFYRLP